VLRKRCRHGTVQSGTANVLSAPRLSLCHTAADAQTALHTLQSTTRSDINGQLVSQLSCRGTAAMDELASPSSLATLPALCLSRLLAFCDSHSRRQVRSVCYELWHVAAPGRVS
jgi:hypothetical protein